MSTKKLIHLDWEVHQHTEGTLNECLVFPVQRNFFHLSVNGSFQEHQKMWNTMKHTGRTFISAMIPWGTKQYNFPSWNRTHTVRVTQGCSSKWLWGLNQISAKQWTAKGTRNITHTHTHTHTHTQLWYLNCYLVNKFLNSYLLNSHNEQDQKSLNTPGQPGESHQFPH
jgi:hypothetical protein